MTTIPDGLTLKAFASPIPPRESSRIVPQQTLPIIAIAAVVEEEVAVAEDGEEVVEEEGEAEEEVAVIRIDPPNAETSATNSIYVVDCTLVCGCVNVDC